MLLTRSIQSISFCILTISILSAKCQYYDADYNANVEAEDDHSSSYNSGDDKPDYSKYYSGGGSAPLLGGVSGELKETDQGFVSPLDFSGFFGSSNFGTESKAPLTNPIIPIQNPFIQEEDGSKANAGFVNAQDFNSGFSGSSIEFSPSNFEDSFKEPQIEQTKAEPKDTYVPKKKPYKTKKYKSEVDDLNGNYNSGTYKKPTGKTSYEKSLDYVSPKYDYNPLPTKSNLYNPIVPTLSSYTGAGTINQLAPVKTYVPQYFPVKHTNVALSAQTTLPSYQSLQSLPSLEKIQSTLSPFNPNPTSYYNPTADYSQSSQYAQPTEFKSQQIKSNNKCTKVAKQLSPDDISHGRFRRQADKMNCYLCTDPKTGGKYEQCSYTSDPGNDDSYFRGHAEKYSTKTYSDPDHYRNKRSAANKERKIKRKRNDEKEEVEYSSPFNYEKENSHKLSSKPAEFDESSYYKSPDFGHYEKESDNYRFGPEYFTDATNQEKSYSEKQSDELVKNGENCKKVKKDSMTCMVCSNPKTGGNFEQCSYTSEPTEKKFSYVKEKKYNSNDPQPEEKTVESSESKPTFQIQRGKSRFQPHKFDTNHQFSASTKHPKQINREDKHDYSIPQFSASTKHSTNSDDYNIPHHFIHDAKAELKSRFDSKFHEEPAENRQVNNKKPSEKEQDDYVYKLFPEYAERETKNQEIKQKPGYEYHSDLPEYFTAEESKKDVDSVLQEFTKKDRSKCKKITKDKMTCYICQDDKGVQHEECMFVSESQPKSSHIAYHEVKEFSTDPKKNGEAEETADTKQSSETVPLNTQKRKVFPKKVKPISLKDVDVEPTEHIKISSSKSPRIVRRKTNISKDLLGSLAQESQRSEVKVKRSDNSSNEKEEQNVDAEEINEPETENADGAYASELKPIFSEKLGMTLPAYMLEISEGEKIFDEAVGRDR